MKKLRDWADQTIFFAMNQKRHGGGPFELFEQMALKARAVSDRFMAEADQEGESDPGRMILTVPKKVFDWVAQFRAQP
jgi:hypothetical protein